MARVGAWTLTLDSVRGWRDQPAVTRVRAPYVNRDGFRFTAARANPLQKLASQLGLLDGAICTGDPAFDGRFTLKTNDRPRLQALLTSATLRGRLAAVPRVRLEVKPDFGDFAAGLPPGVEEVQAAVPGYVADAKRLVALFDVVTAALDQLRHIGSAGDFHPAYPASPPTPVASPATPGNFTGYRT
jgi:hypothetical protein